MGSRVTTPERRSSVLRRLATILPGISFVALAGAGCPPHEASLTITTTGIVVMQQACRPACDRSEDGGVEPTCACAIDSRAPPDLEHRALQARLFLVTPADQSVRDTSKCMTLLPCADAGLAAKNCLAESLNQQLDGALPQGLGFDGLQNPDDVQLILAFYQPLDAASAPCNRANLVACAGLAPPLGGGSYDISCASCQGGPKNAPGPDNGPCPKPNDKDSCFLKACDAILAKNNY